LLLLAEEATYGYELGIKMAALGFIENENDTALIYRALANLNKGGFVLFRETPGDGGPPRKVYSITPSGRELLHDWQNVIEGRVAMLSRFIKRCAELDTDRKGE
jgi:PadR family transcriptional regulator PadR